MRARLRTRESRLLLYFSVTTKLVKLYGSTKLCIHTNENENDTY